MTKRKTKDEGHFTDPQRDAKLAERSIRIDPRYIQHANKSELVQLAQLIHGVRAHRGMSRSELEQIVLGKVPAGVKNPVDKYRNVVRSFLAENWDRVRDQIDPRCSGDCYNCHDIVVIGCYSVNQKALTQFKETKHGNR